MPLLDGALRDIFGAAFKAVYLDATLTQSSETETGAGGFSTVGTDLPVKVMMSAVSDRARAASGLPETAVSISLLRAGLVAAIGLDDRIAVSGLSYRVIRVEEDPAGAAFAVTAVPVRPQ